MRAMNSKKFWYFLLTITSLVLLYSIFNSFNLWFVNVKLPKSTLLQDRKLYGMYGRSHIEHNMNKNQKLNIPKKKEKRKCDINSKPHTSIFYIKVHKTGSTTLRSLLLTYAMKYNLIICMDPTNLWGLNWPYEIDETKLTKMYTEKCELIAEELVYNQLVVQRLMKPDVFIMASVRHPVEHFLSLYKYSNIHKAVERLLNNKSINYLDGMRIFLKNPKIIKNIYATFTENEVRDKLQLNMVEPNLQLYSLGIRTIKINHIEKVISEIDFITLAEKWNESMVVLQEKLCCSFDDIVYRKQNVQRTKDLNNNTLPDDIRHAILKFNNGDLLLYGLVQRRLYHEILQIDNFDLRLKKYEDILEKYENECNAGRKTCPPKDAGSIGYFVEQIRKKQQQKLLENLRKSYIS